MEKGSGEAAELPSRSGSVWGLCRLRQQCLLESVVRADGTASRWRRLLSFSLVGHSGSLSVVSCHSPASTLFPPKQTKPHS